MESARKWFWFCEIAYRLLLTPGIVAAIVLVRREAVSGNYFELVFALSLLTWVVLQFVLGDKLFDYIGGRLSRFKH
jgi:hypothetical protein